MSIPMKDFTDALEMILRNAELKTVTLFCAPLSGTKQRVRISRRKRFKNELVICWGRPNYAEREFLKLCKKAKTNPKRYWLKYK
jgi:hypothetical protein